MKGSAPPLPARRGRGAAGLRALQALVRFKTGGAAHADADWNRTRIAAAIVALLAVIVTLTAALPLESWARRAVGLRDGRIAVRGRPIEVARVALLSMLPVAERVPDGAPLTVSVNVVNPQRHSLALCASLITLELSRDASEGDALRELRAQLEEGWSRSTKRLPCALVGDDDRPVPGRARGGGDEDDGGDDDGMAREPSGASAGGRTRSGARMGALWHVPRHAFGEDLEAAAAKTRLAQARATRRAAKRRGTTAAAAAAKKKKKKKKKKKAWDTNIGRRSVLFLVVYAENHNTFARSDFEFTVDARIAPRFQVAADVVAALSEIVRSGVASLHAAMAAVARRCAEWSGGQRVGEWIDAVRVDATCIARRRRSGAGGSGRGGGRRGALGELSVRLLEMERAAWGGLERYVLGMARRVVDGADAAWADGHVVVLLLAVVAVGAYFPLQRRVQQKGLAAVGISRSNWSLTRVVSSASAHADLWHLGANVAALLHVGPAVHTALGCSNDAVLALYAAAALSAAVVSAYAPCRRTFPPTFSIGASGAFLLISYRGVGRYRCSRRWSAPFSFLTTSSCLFSNSFITNRRDLRPHFGVARVQRHGRAARGLCCLGGVGCVALSDARQRD